MLPCCGAGNYMRWAGQKFNWSKINTSSTCTLRKSLCSQTHCHMRAEKTFHLNVPPVLQHLRPEHHSASPSCPEQPNNAVSGSIHTHTLTHKQLHALDRRRFIWSRLWISSCIHTHTHTHACTPSVHTVREHPSTPQRVPVRCVVKIYMTRWQTDSGRAAILPVSLLTLTGLLLLTVHMCERACARGSPTFMQNQLDNRNKTSDHFCRVCLTV